MIFIWLMGETAVSQHILNELVQSRRRPDDSVEVKNAIGPESFAKTNSQYLREAFHGPQWRAQVVRKAITKGFQFSDRFLKACGPFLDHFLKIIARMIEGLFQLFPFRRVTGDFRKSFQPALPVVHGPDGARQKQAAAVFADVPALVQAALPGHG